MAKGKHKGRRPEPLDHWPTLRALLVTLTGELGRFPSMNDLERRGRYDVMRAMVHHGGGPAVARRVADEVQAAADAPVQAQPAEAPADGAAARPAPSHPA